MKIIQNHPILGGWGGGKKETVLFLEMVVEGQTENKSKETRNEIPKFGSYGQGNTTNSRDWSKLPLAISKQIEYPPTPSPVGH